MKDELTLAHLGASVGKRLQLGRAERFVRNEHNRTQLIARLS